MRIAALVPALACWLALFLGFAATPAGAMDAKPLAAYAREMKRLNAVVGEQEPSLLSSLMRSRGTRAFYQVRIGADTRPVADALCNRIRKAGGACFVLKNRGVAG